VCPRANRLDSLPVSRQHSHLGSRHRSQQAIPQVCPRVSRLHSLRSLSPSR
jgi:hypothetical protein